MTTTTIAPAGNPATTTAEAPAEPPADTDPDPEPTPDTDSGSAAFLKPAPGAGAETRAPVFRPVPVWFFAFEGLIGAAYDVVKSSPYGWTVMVTTVVANIVLARTVMRGRLNTARAMLKGRGTRKILAGLIALRVGLHLALGALGKQAVSGPAHLTLAAVMCGSTVALLAFNQRVTLRALNGGGKARIC
ncbi:hypothetical protein [Streptomyces sp. HPF1205]|uniref:hypothetical protein n=1 Tax=Streptomyces sp. HPF1205 TaxID=2873262 RepID=UPI001CEDDBBB|nr:hypothetical protein [Streptomyces sp. HPF1205]